MKLTAFLCDKNWKIQKLIKTVPDFPLEPGTRLTSLVEHPEYLTQKEELHFQKETAVVLTFSGTPEKIPALICAFSHSYLVFLTHVRSQEDFAAFTEEFARIMSWAEDHIDGLYQDEYFQIQQINNQLINSQRALVKSNQRLKQLLDEVREANDVISLLERDKLTNLYCISAFYRKAGLLLTRFPDRQYDVIILDIAHFNLVNEIFGRNVGDLFLQELSAFLTDLDQENEGILARVPADTFYLFMPSERHFYGTLASSFQRFIQNYPIPLRVSPQIGVYSMSGKEAGITIEQMCDRAHLALASVKEANSSNIGFYNQSLHQKMMLQHDLHDSVQKALEHHEFQLYLQPKVDLVTEEVIGAEALIRWFHPTMGFIPPDQFIPYLEQNGDIYQVDQFIWEEACRVLQTRKKQGLRSLPISVNVARADFYRPDLTQVLKNLLAKYQLHPADLKLEVIERAYVHDSQNMFRVLSELRKMGFYIEMDDFGTGESSLAMLAEMPVNCLKLDRQFLISASHSPRHSQIIGSIINMACSLSLDVIAEGVETKEQATLLLSMGCRYAQGYYYGRPEPAERFLAIP